MVLTTGTFLRGVIHVGSQLRAAGRMPAASTAPSAAAAAAAAAADAADTTAAIAAGVCLFVGRLLACRLPQHMQPVQVLCRGMSVGLTPAVPPCHA